MKSKPNVTLDFGDFDDQEELSEEEKAAYDEMESYFDQSLEQFKEGKIVNGTIMEMSKDTVTIDVGFKSEGIIFLNEFPENGKNIAVGDMIEVFLERVEDNNGNVVLPRKKPTRLNCGMNWLKPTRRRKSFREPSWPKPKED